MTCERFAGETSRLGPDDLPLVAALAAQGAQARAVPWQDLEGSDQLDGLIVRSPWDYSEGTGNLRKFAEAMSSLPPTLKVFNPWPVIQWNLNKTYLWQLASVGVDIIPTIDVDQYDWVERPDPWPHRAWVFKPSISAGSRLTFRFEGSAPDKLKKFLSQRLEYEQSSDWIESASWLVQPFLPEVQTAGEWSLVYIDGRFSHAALKRPAPDHWYVQSEHGGQYEFKEPPAPLRALGDRDLQLIANHLTDQIGPQPVVYARLDYLSRGEEYLLGEAELFEPELFLPAHPKAASQLAKAVLRECAGLGG